MIGLVHLVWAPLGPEPLARFLECYAREPAGAEHELVVLYNGFDDDRAIAGHRALLGHVAQSHREVVLPERLQDLAAYDQAARVLEHDQLCFLNSHSRPQNAGWLGALVEHMHASTVGLVGATGTFESQVEGAALGGQGHESLLWLRRRVAVRRARALYPPFPNPHVRTNAFAIDRERLLSLDLGRAVDKLGAHRLESGWEGMSRRLRERGLRTLVVGRDRRAYEPEQWPASRTFRSGNQENLLVSDNRTREYDEASPERRRELELLAWGRSA